MEKKWRRRAWVACVMALDAGLTSCSGGKAPFLLAQACLGDASEVAEFRSEFQKIAERYDMEISDRSEAVASELQMIGRDSSSQPIQIHMEERGGPSVSATNLGMGDYEVVIGFNGGSDTAANQAFAADVLTTLNSHWQFRILPSDQGGLPTDCGGKKPE